MVGRADAVQREEFTGAFSKPYTLSLKPLSLNPKP
jgi:hypothetical protein